MYILYFIAVVILHVVAIKIGGFYGNSKKSGTGQAVCRIDVS
jgi:hypothetical protein